MSSGSFGAIAGHDTSQVSKGIPRALGMRWGRRKKPSGAWRSFRSRPRADRGGGRGRFWGVLTVLKLLTAGRVLNILKILTGAGLGRVVLTLGGDYQF